MVNINPKGHNPEEIRRLFQQLLQGLKTDYVPYSGAIQDVNLGAFDLIATQIQSVAAGISPLIIASQTKVDNLNADLLDGYNSTDFIMTGSLGNLVTGSGILLSGAVLNSIVGGGNVLVTNSDRGSTAVTSHESTYNHSLLHSPLTVADSLSLNLTLNGQLLSGTVLPAGIDHGGLTGLSDDDHAQYLLASGARALSGAWNMGSQATTNVNIDSGTINAITDLSVNGEARIGGAVNYAKIDSSGNLSLVGTNDYLVSAVGKYAFKFHTGLDGLKFGGVMSYNFCNEAGNDVFGIDYVTGSFRTIGTGSLLVDADKAAFAYTNSLEYRLHFSAVRGAYEFWTGTADDPAFSAGTSGVCYAKLKMGIGQTAPSALLHMKAGTATAGTAPIKFTAGTNLTTAEAGTMEFNGSDYFLTI
jgi:hypothetical protein